MYFDIASKQYGPFKFIYTSLSGPCSPKHIHHPILSILQVCVSLSPPCIILFANVPVMLSIMHCFQSIFYFIVVGLLMTNARAEPGGRYPGNRGEGNLDPPSMRIRAPNILSERNTYPYPSYQDCLNSIENVPGDKSTFYSGLGYYPNGQGYVYLKNFIAARGLLEVDSVYPEDFCTSDPNLNGGYGAYISFAYSFSGVFAQKSSGTAYLLTPSQCDPSPNSIWNIVELGNLTTSEGAQVTKIIRVDPATTSISTTIFPTPSGSTLPTQAVCPTDPPLPSGGASGTASATSTASPTPSVAPVADIQCDASLGVATSDALNAQLSLVAEGNGPSSSNCCAGGTVPCEQIAINGTAAVDLCGGAKQQCAGCGDLAAARWCNAAIKFR